MSAIWDFHRQFIGVVRPLGATVPFTPWLSCQGSRSWVTLVATEARRGQNRAITSGIQGMLISRLGWRRRRADFDLAARQGQLCRWRRNGLYNRKAYYDDPKAEPL